MITFFLMLFFGKRVLFLDRFMLWALFDVVLELVMCLIIIGATLYE